MSLHVALLYCRITTHNTTTQRPAYTQLISLTLKLILFRTCQFAHFTSELDSSLMAKFSRPDGDLLVIASTNGQRTSM
jgi:hypothetical protein